jgi:hypothetical protein
MNEISKVIFNKKDENQLAIDDLYKKANDLKKENPKEAVELFKKANEMAFEYMDKYGLFKFNQLPNLLDLIGEKEEAKKQREIISAKNLVFRKKKIQDQWNNLNKNKNKPEHIIIKNGIGMQICQYHKDILGKQILVSDPKTIEIINSLHKDERCRCWFVTMANNAEMPKEISDRVHERQSVQDLLKQRKEHIAKLVRPKDEVLLDNKNIEIPEQSKTTKKIEKTIALNEVKNKIADTKNKINEERLMYEAKEKDTKDIKDTVIKNTDNNFKELTNDQKYFSKPIIIKDILKDDIKEKVKDEDIVEEFIPKPINPTRIIVDDNVMIKEQDNNLQPQHVKKYNYKKQSNLPMLMLGVFVVFIILLLAKFFFKI